MNSIVYNFILNKEHHAYRHIVDWKLAEEYSAKGLSAVERMADRFERLCDEEKAVIDSFQGEKAYNEVMQKSSYYLAPVTNNQMLMLEGDLP